MLAPRELAEQIRDLAHSRELVTVGRDLAESALDTSESVAPGERIERAAAALSSLLDTAGDQQSRRKIEARPYQWTDPASLKGRRAAGADYRAGLPFLIP